MELLTSLFKLFIYTENCNLNFFKLYCSLKSFKTNHTNPTATIESSILENSAVNTGDFSPLKLAMRLSM